MTTRKTYLLSNLAAGLFVDLEVSDEQDLLVAARDRLRDEGYPLEVQQGFFVSLYPHRRGEETTESSGPDSRLQDDNVNSADELETLELIRD